MDLNWSTVRGKDILAKWTSIQKMASKMNVDEYELLRELIRRDPSAFRRAKGEENRAGPTNIELECAVLVNATHFVIMRYHQGYHNRERAEVQTFDAAVRAAGDDPRALVYGVCKSETTANLTRKNWDFYKMLLRAVDERG